MKWYATRLFNRPLVVSIQSEAPQRARRLFLRSPSVPLRASAISGAMPPACASALLLSASKARLHNARAARSFCPSVPLRASATATAVSTLTTDAPVATQRTNTKALRMAAGWQPANLLRRAGARSHDFVVAIGFAHPPSSSPRDPNSIRRPRNAELSPLWQIGQLPSSLPAHMFGDPERHTLAVAWS